MEIGDSLWLFLLWGSPIGLGAFLAGLGVYTYLDRKADEIKQRMKDQDKK